MNQTISKLSKGILFASVGLAMTLFLISCSKDPVVSATITYSISGNASGAQAVPTSSNNNGSGTISGTYNSSTKVMSYTTTWASLTGAPLSGGLYTGASGVVGTSIAAWTLGSGLTASGTFSTTTTLNAEQEAKLLAGNCYYILGTAANASGEIRGQISATAQ